MKFAQLVIGPAGSGKSTFCDAIQQHCKVCRRNVHIMNIGATPPLPRRRALAYVLPEPQQL